MFNVHLIHLFNLFIYISKKSLLTGGEENKFFFIFLVFYTKFCIFFYLLHFQYMNFMLFSILLLLPPFPHAYLDTSCVRQHKSTHINGTLPKHLSDFIKQDELFAHLTCFQVFINRWTLKENPTVRSLFIPPLQQNLHFYIVTQHNA